MSTLNVSALQDAINQQSSANSQNTVVNQPETDKTEPTKTSSSASNSDSQPQQQQQQEQQEQPKKLKVIIGLPGDHFSQAFLLAWTNTIYTLISSNRYDLKISPGKSSFVPFARMHTLGLDVLRGKAQKAFHTESYDVFVSIDSDVVFSAVQLIELIECTKVHPVVSGYYMMQDNKNFAVVK